MNFLWSSLQVYCSLWLMLAAVPGLGMGWSGENVGALSGVDAVIVWRAGSVAKVRSADILSVGAGVFLLRIRCFLVAIPAFCHGRQWVGAGELGPVTRGGGGRLARRAIVAQYITSPTKFCHCNSAPQKTKKRGRR